MIWNRVFRVLGRTRREAGSPTHDSGPRGTRWVPRGPRSATVAVDAAYIPTTYSRPSESVVLHGGVKPWSRPHVWQCTVLPIVRQARIGVAAGQAGLRTR